VSETAVASNITAHDTAQSLFAIRPILSFLCLKPVVHFAYFPSWKHLFFRDFSNKQERIYHATRAYRIAESRGWNRVVEAMKSYGVIAEQFYPDPSGYVDLLKQNQ
jgi:hypothetical protein